MVKTELCENNNHVISLTEFSSSTIMIGDRCDFKFLRVGLERGWLIQVKKFPDVRKYRPREIFLGQG